MEQAPKWVLENKTHWVKVAKLLGLYEPMVAYARVKTARRAVSTLKMVSVLKPALTQFSDMELQNMLRACREDAGIEPLGEVGSIGF